MLIKPESSEEWMIPDASVLNYRQTYYEDMKVWAKSIGLDNPGFELRVGEMIQLLGLPRCAMCEECVVTLGDDNEGWGLVRYGTF